MSKADKNKPEEPIISDEKPVLKPISDIIGRIRKRYGDDSIEQASKSRALVLERMPSGIYGIDRLTEGGWPLGRIVQFYGKESGGKSVTLLKSIANAQRYCKTCLKVRPERKIYIGEKECECSKPEDFDTVFLDTEGTYDANWASSVGVNNDLVWVIRPAYAEQGLDVVDGIVRESNVPYVIIDTLTMLSPKEEIEKSAEDGMIDKRAKLINSALRKWVAAMNEQGMKARRRLTLFLVCHINMGIGIYAVEEKAGGKTKEFANSIELRFKKAKSGIIDVGRMSEIECEVKKTKITSTFGDIATFNLITKKSNMFDAGWIDETESIFKDAIALGLLIKEKKNFILDKRAGVTIPEEITTQEAMKTYMMTNHKEYEIIKRFVLDFMFGNLT